MKLQRNFLPGLFILFLLSCGTTKYVPINDDQLKGNLKKHISTLASDDFAGRETGAPGEQKSYEYIIKEFKKAGLKPKGEKGFLQPFPFTAGAEFGSSTQLVVNSNIYVPGVDFFPLPYSSNAVVTNYITKLQYGITDILNKRDDYKGKLNISKRIFLLEIGTPDRNDPHGKFGDWTDLRKKIDLAVSHGAAGIIFINFMLSPHLCQFPNRYA